MLLVELNYSLLVFAPNDIGQRYLVVPSPLKGKTYFMGAGHPDKIILQVFN